MVWLRLACLASTLLAMGAIPVSAESCLQRFSCQLYGECRLPCLDELTGRPSAAAPDPVPAAAQPKGAAMSSAKAPRTFPSRDRGGVAKAAGPALVRVLARNDVTALDQLAGRPVSFGPEGKPAAAAARKMFAKLGIRVRETPLDIDNALDGLATGDIAAVIVVGDRDVAKLRTLKTDELHLVGVADGVDPPDGMRATITKPTTLPKLSRGIGVRTFALASRQPALLDRHRLATRDGVEPAAGRSVASGLLGSAGR